jgi:hypothetical protein
LTGSGRAEARTAESRRHQTAELASHDQEKHARGAVLLGGEPPQRKQRDTVDVAAPDVLVGQELLDPRRPGVERKPCVAEMLGPVLRDAVDGRSDPVQQIGRGRRVARIETMYTLIAAWC